MNTTPHILVDATAIPENRGGVGRYLEYLLPALAIAGARLSIVATNRDRDWLAAAVPAATVIAANGASRSRPQRLVWEQIELPRLATRLGADVLHSPHYTMPIFSRVPVAVTLHDATFFSLPQLHGRLKRVFFRGWTRYCLRHAAVCIVPSEATRSEVVARVRRVRAPIVVAYHGVDRTRFRAPTRTEVTAASELVGSARWIAFLGTLEPRKNVGNLVRAFERVWADQPDLVLALAGGRGWDDELTATLDASPARDRVARLGYVSDAELPGLLGGAIAVAYPSLGEGFGLPVLEAMSCGATVLTTRLLALPEVGGDVAIYTEPDAASIARALAAIIDNPDQKSRLGFLGVARANEFTWARSAAEHLGAYATATARGVH